MFGIGMGEFILILIVGLIIFGPKNLPEVGKALGKGLREFRKAQAALSATLEESANETPKKPAEKVSTEKVSTEKKSEPAEPARVTVDDVINSAKQNPIVKEEKQN
jgi:TatA/E family protein of Tat protein translocase